MISHVVQCNPSGQIIATSHDLTPNGGLAWEILLFQGNLGWWNIIIWPDPWKVRLCLARTYNVVRNTKNWLRPKKSFPAFTASKKPWVVSNGKKALDTRFHHPLKSAWIPRVRRVYWLCIYISWKSNHHFFIGWFPNHHYFSRGLSSSKRNHHF